MPRFSVGYLDRAIEPGVDFYHFACGTWVKDNPVPADKSRWGSFAELRERNLFLIHDLLESAATARVAANSPAQQVADFCRSAMDTNRLERLGLEPIAAELARIDRMDSMTNLFALLAGLHASGIPGMFGVGVSPDAKNSGIYAFDLRQGGLSLPDRDYYLKESFARIREAYRAHVTRMLTLLGEEPAVAAGHAATVLELETALARASRTRVELRDPNKNYNKFATAEIVAPEPGNPVGDVSGRPRVGGPAVRDRGAAGVFQRPGPVGG
ncbi:MAG: hypothetical protein KGS61_01715 [Verrucomicrobia bacterium]|nr:hypothetical protein [Verrucomicrobiota bacterium]